MPDGGVAVEDGRIVAVGPAAELEGERRSFADAVIVPAFVNAHSHLEYAVYAGFGDGLSFPPWIDLHVDAQAPAARRRRGRHRPPRRGRVPPLRDRHDRRRELHRRGRRRRAPSSASPGSSTWRSSAPTRRRRSSASPSCARRSPSSLSERLALGVSPHAPYTTSAAVYEACAGLGAAGDDASGRERGRAGLAPARQRDDDGRSRAARRAAGHDRDPHARRARPARARACSPRTASTSDDEEIALLASTTPPSPTARARTRSSAAAPRRSRASWRAASGSASAPTAPPRRRRSTCSRRCEPPSTPRARASARPDALSAKFRAGTRYSWRSACARARGRDGLARRRKARRPRGRLARRLAVPPLGGANDRRGLRRLARQGAPDPRRRRGSVRGRRIRMARTSTQRKRRPRPPAQQRAAQAEDLMFFPKLRRRAKWVFLFLAIAFAFSFVFFGVGAGGSGIGDYLSDLFNRPVSSDTPSLDDAQEAVAERPNDPAAQLDLAKAAQADGQLDLAVTAYEEYRAMRPNDTDALRTLAALYGTQIAEAQRRATIASNEAAEASLPNTLAPEDSEFLQDLTTNPLTASLSARAEARANAANAEVQTPRRRAARHLLEAGRGDRRRPAALPPVGQRRRDRPGLRVGDHGVRELPRAPAERRQRRADPGAHRLAEGDHRGRGRRRASGHVGRRLRRRVERLGYEPGHRRRGRAHELRHQRRAG